jgi:hypothetical protein
MPTLRASPCKTLPDLRTACTVSYRVGRCIYTTRSVSAAQYPKVSNGEVSVSVCMCLCVCVCACACADGCFWQGGTGALKLGLGCRWAGSPAC